VQPLHYWLEDEAFNRVALEFDGERSRRVGNELMVRGTFHYRADRWH
jgi:hypothetical protein